MLGHLINIVSSFVTNIEENTFSCMIDSALISCRVGSQKL